MAIDFNGIKKEGYGDGYIAFYHAGESSAPTCDLINAVGSEELLDRWGIEGVADWRENSDFEKALEAYEAGYREAIEVLKRMAI